MRTALAGAVLLAAVLVSFQSFTPGVARGVLAPTPGACLHGLDPERVVNIAIEWDHTQAGTQAIYSVPADAYLYVTDYAVAGRRAYSTRLVEDLAGVQVVKVPTMHVSEGTVHLFNGSFRTPLIFSPGSLVVVEFLDVFSNGDRFDCVLSGQLVPQ